MNIEGNNEAMFQKSISKTSNELGTGKIMNQEGKDAKENFEEESKTKKLESVKMENLMKTGNDKCQAAHKSNEENMKIAENFIANFWHETNMPNKKNTIVDEVMQNESNCIKLNERNCIVSIECINQNLIGSLPSEIENLINLQILNLRENLFNGSVPHEIGRLINLTKLDLSNNQLTGHIPAEIGKLTNLTDLNLGQNQLTGCMPSEIGNLINLKTINVVVNQLTGSIPPEIGKLINLTYLDLSINNFTGSIPPEICNLINLKTFKSNWNQLTGSVPKEIVRMKKLKAVLLIDNADLSKNVSLRLKLFFKVNGIEFQI